MSEARYAVGIDLGTTHCVMAAVDLTAEEQDGTVQLTVPVPQLTAPGAVEERPMLPSFLYLPHPDELKPDDRILPWGQPQPFVIGELARTMGSRTPIRLVASAKSWLCHPGIDRRAAILPVEAPEEVQRVSPLQASIRYLEHLRAAWDQQYPDYPLTGQDVILTVPASFDPAARELTAEAAAAVGLSRLVLLEEPQAALYHWILAAQGEWRKQVKVGDIILVIDLGGGTADFSLIAVTERDGSLELERVAVGDHILLGGDNMDLALAHAVRVKLVAQGTQLDPWQLQGITHGCRSAKETLLSDAKAEAVPVVVPSRGSKLIGGTLRTELTRAEVAQNLVEGFFPAVDAAARPASRARAALTKLGLPYAQDPAMTRHLASFLARQVGATRDLAGFEDRLPADATFLHPTAVLFNGGVFKAQPLLERTLKVLNDWLAAEDAPPVRLLEGADLDLAVARGAAYYGFVRRGRGVRIRGGTAKSYYVGVESAMPAVPGMEPPIEVLCIAPFGMEEGTQAELPPQEVGLVIGEPVRFRFFGSSVRRTDQVGAALEQWAPEEIEELEEIEATLPAEGRQVGDVVPVRLRAAVTEVGTLRLEAVPRDGSEGWKVEFDVRGES
ncbi:putative heat-shock chaperone Hsp70/DnaK [Candidatus Competibacter denitrificans Run_A_D11]|mgnify:CR=1 FL=1|uniref:Heat-shock chaperone Hsp70/DnaK n=1 Tax=Candidatus Competibacter denitrificans Run_A_D11 TaxID=1400863 RepID=W6M5D9_9GAMM|nr:Hsp70 family protein [Candidatus Competibacter denitrificans]CDI01000.1 putative heat-shock chaperone Hsp70/DnaK [Candidatus Competibacter denitrificans Run_A_D11]